MGEPVRILDLPHQLIPYHQARPTRSTPSTAPRRSATASTASGNIQSINTATIRITDASPTTNRLTGAVDYDPADNLTSWSLLNQTGNFYQYDKLHQMTRTAAASGTQIWLSMYDANDERVWSYKEGANPRFDRWTLRDLDGKVLRTYEATNYAWIWKEDHVYRGDTLIASATPTGTSHLHTDHLGAVRAHTNTSGTRTAYHAYYPFGEEATAVNQNAQRMKFTGHERDLGDPTSAADDLDYMHARFYNGQTGRFLSTDPVDSANLTIPQSWNYYAYAVGNPLRYTDPTGESPWDAVKGFGNAFASNLSLGLYARVESNNPDFQAGQRLGDQAAHVAGLYEASQGTGAVAGAAVCTAGSAGGRTPAAAPAAAAGVVAIGTAAPWPPLRHKTSPPPWTMEEAVAGPEASRARIYREMEKAGLSLRATRDGGIRKEIPGRRTSFTRTTGMSRTEKAGNFVRSTSMVDKSGQDQKTRKNNHPYESWEGTKVWRVLESAIAELAKNQDIQEMTPREYIVGYLTKRLSDDGLI